MGEHYPQILAREDKAIGVGPFIIHYLGEWKKGCVQAVQQCKYVGTTGQTGGLNPVFPKIAAWKLIHVFKWFKKKETKSAWKQILYPPI